MALTPKQERFVQEYLVDLNATQAAIRAGYSEKTANEQGAQNLAKLSIQEAIREGQRKIAERIDVTVEKIVQEYARLGFSDIRNYVSFCGDKVTLRDSEELSENQSRAIAEVSQTETKFGTNISFKLHDKKGALDSLSKHLGMFVDKSEVKEEIHYHHHFPDVLTQALEKASKARNVQ